MTEYPKEVISDYPQVTIIVCTYNRKDELSACLDSLVVQDYPNFDIIVVDDGSTDGTIDLLKEYKARHNIQVVRNEINKGVSGARNAGIRNATGEIIAFTDDDCIATQNWITELVRGFSIDKKIMIVGGRIDDPTPTNILGIATKGLYFITNKDSYDHLPTGGNLACKREYLIHNLFDETLKYGSDDDDLCQTCLEKGYKFFFRFQASVIHNHRSTFWGLMRQRYIWGTTLIWFRLKHRLPPGPACFT